MSVGREGASIGWPATPTRRGDLAERVALDMPSDPQQDYEHFPTTHWSLVNRAGGVEATQASQALNQLLTRYLPALRAHLTRNKRLDAHRADDIVQEFISTKFLEQDLAAVADPARGKFRTLVLTALDRFLVSQQRRSSAKKRSADEAATLEGDALQAAASPAQKHAADPFDIEWARQLLAEVASRMESECHSCGKEDVWAIFEARILNPTFRATEPVDYASLVERFGLRSPTQAANILVTAKRMFQRILRSVVGEYALSAEPIDEEIRALHQILSTSGAGPR